MSWRISRGVWLIASYVIANNFIHERYVPCINQQYIKILRDGNGRGFSLKLFILGLQRAARYVRHATVGACRRTSNRQEHKIIQRAGPEQDTIFHLHVTACRRRGSHRQDQRLAWVASLGQGTSCSSSFVSKVLGANYKTANNFLPVAQKFTTCTDRKQPLNLPVMRTRV